MEKTRLYLMIEAEITISTEGAVSLDEVTSNMIPSFECQSQTSNADITVNDVTITGASRIRA